jgi:RNA polymerase sigma-B factor
MPYWAPQRAGVPRPSGADENQTTSLGPGEQAVADPLTRAEQTLRGLGGLRGPARARAREEVIELCTPWARWEAARYRNRGESSDDLGQVAVVGLILAVDRYDPTRQVPFQRFAQPTITGELKKHFRDFGWSTHVTRHVQEVYQRLRRGEPELAQQLGHAPTDQELAEFLDLSNEDIVRARRGELAYRARSLNRPRFDDGEVGELVDDLGSLDPAIEMIADRDALRRALAVLPLRLRLVLSLRVVDELTQAGIADRLGVSQMHVSRLLTRALGLLRNHMLAGARPPLRAARPARVGRQPGRRAGA